VPTAAPRPDAGSPRLTTPVVASAGEKARPSRSRIVSGRWNPGIDQDAHFAPAVHAGRAHQHVVRFGIRRADERPSEVLLASREPAPRDERQFDKITTDEQLVLRGGASLEIREEGLEALTRT
jgi:hypothetical protein